MLRQILVSLLLASTASASAAPLATSAKVASIAPSADAGTAVSIRQIGTATLQNVPEIPADITQAVQRYQNSRAAEFQGWLPDGSMLVATRFGATKQVHHVAAPGAARTQITFSDEPIASAHVIPGTDRFILVRDTGGDEWFQLYERGLQGTARQITQAVTRASTPLFSQDGQLMIWASASKGSAHYDLLSAVPGSQAAPKLLHRVEGAVTPAALSADGKQLLYLRSLSNRESQIFSLDLETGKAQQIAPKASKARYEAVRFMPNSPNLIAISDRDSDVRRLVEIDPKTGREVVLTPGLKWDVEAYDLSADGRVLAYSVNADGYSQVHVQNRLTRNLLPQATLPEGVLTALKFNADGSQLAVGITNATSAGDIWSWKVQSGELTRWTRSELGELDASKLSVPELIRFKSFDGREIPAFVYRPKSVPVGVKTPVIMDIHGGPEAQTRPVWNYGAQYFADVLGATVILPNVRGSDGYGKAYLNLDNAEKREDSVKDIGALLDWIGTQADLDSERVAVYGQSYGGYMSMAVMTHYSDRLVGGVNRYGISDFNTFLERTEAYRRDNRRAEYGDERKPAIQKLFKRIAPANNVHKITKPMLVMQGANDPRVPQYESDQIVERLRANGNEVWYVLYADEGHGFHKKPNNDLRREVETLFLQKLFAK